MKFTHKIYLFFLALINGSSATAKNDKYDWSKTENYFSNRFACELVIQKNNWFHSVWPQENSSPKPTFEDIKDDRAINKLVEDNIREESILRAYFGEVISKDMIQSELNRIILQTKSPKRLKEIFLSFDMDPKTISECIVRPYLVNRAIRYQYGIDSVIHAHTKKIASDDIQLLKQSNNTDYLKAQVVNFRVVKKDRNQILNHNALNEIELSYDDWNKIKANNLKKQRLIETQNGFYFHTIKNSSKSSLDLETLFWPKTPFHDWFETIELRSVEIPKVHSGLYLNRIIENKSEINANGTTSDYWENAGGIALERTGHTAIWTGSEMIIWGGFSLANGGTNPVEGGKYNPVTDSWAAINTLNAPIGRTYHSAIWTGTEMIIWGGANNEPGGIYNPANDSWSSINSTNEPTSRAYHSAVWTGDEMIIWGGMDENGFNITGAKYDPNTDTWNAISTSQSPEARRFHSTIWTGDEMIVWGGFIDNVATDLNTGGRYNPVNDSWLPTNTSSIWTSQSRRSHSALWTGDEMIIWGGNRTRNGNTSNVIGGSRYTPHNDEWVQMSISNEPEGRSSHFAIWTGDEMIIWGGNGDDPGGKYKPSTNSWSTVSQVNSPPQGNIFQQTVIWAGSEMIVWGGGPEAQNSGGRYNPISDSWVETSVPGPLSGRWEHTATWTGTEVYFIGGYDGVRYQTNIGSYSPIFDRFGTSNVQSGNLVRHSAIWTGQNIVVWGGEYYSNDQWQYPRGFVYSPSTDTGFNITSDNSPPRTAQNTAVWTGSEMIVWGGKRYDFPALNTGGRYNPKTNTWASLNQIDSPIPRYGHTGLLHESKMIVWGGEANNQNLFKTNTGGIYDVINDSWQEIAISGAPSPRTNHSAVLADDEMIIWGGVDTNVLDDGKKLNILNNSWESYSLFNAPSPRELHTAVWTGDEMIIWGGNDGQNLSTGGRYNPTTDEWLNTSITNSPSERVLHSATDLSPSLVPRLG